MLEPVPDTAELADIEAVGRHVDEDGVLQVAGAVRDEHVVDEVLAEFTAGYLVGGGQVADIDLLPMDLPDVLPSTATPSSCNGINGYRLVPTEIVFLDSCNSAALNSMLMAGAAVATIAAAIMAATGVGAVAAGVIAGALALYGALFTFCGRYNRGIGILIASYAPPALSCGSQ